MVKIFPQGMDENPFILYSWGPGDERGNHDLHTVDSEYSRLGIRWLTHWGRATHICVSKLTIFDRYWLVSWPAPSRGHFVSTSIFAGISEYDPSFKANNSSVLCSDWVNMISTFCSILLDIWSILIVFFLFFWTGSFLPFGHDRWSLQTRYHLILTKPPTK